MSVLSCVAFLAVLSLLIGSTVAANATYTFCYKITGLGKVTLDDPYSIAVLVTGTYDNTLLTSTYNASTKVPAGQYFNLLTANGTRTIRTRNAINVTYGISSLAPVKTDFSDNRFYVTANSSLTGGEQFVDGNGLTFNLNTTAEFPGKTFASQYNLYRSGIFYGVLEDKTSGEDLTKFSVTANINSWTGTAYVAGSCVPPALNGTATKPTAPPKGVYSVTVRYNLSSTARETNWTVGVVAVFDTDGAVYGPDPLGDYYFILSNKSLSVNGTRTYCIAGSCSTSAIYAAAPIGTAGFADNRVYNYKPYFDYNGIAYYIYPAQPKPGYTSSDPAANRTTTVNPYVSKGGSFFEGFGNGGTGPNGSSIQPPTFLGVNVVLI